MDRILSNNRHTKHSILMLYILLGGVILFLVNKAPVRDTLYSFYTNYGSTDSITEYSGMTNLPTNMQEQIDEIQSYQFFKNHKYAEAIQAITGQSSKSYYNLGTLKTLRAYNQALGSTLSGLQQARYLITDAYKDFDTAEKIKLNNALDTYIQANKTLSQKLGTIIQIKTCYGEYSAIVGSLQSFLQQLDDTKSLLTQEQKSIENATNIDAKCLQNLKSINITSQTQLKQLRNQIQGYDETYKSDFANDIKQPIGCLENNMTDIGSTITDAQKSVNDFSNGHKNTMAALLSQDKKAIASLCDFAKNDAQINNQIDNSLNKLIQQLQSNLNQKQQQSKKNSDKTNDPQTSSEENHQTPALETSGSSEDIQYKNVFGEDELRLLQQIDTNNKSLIQQIQNIKGAGKYNAKSLLNKLFENFYGNTGTFDNILKPSDTQSKR